MRNLRSRLIQERTDSVPLTQKHLLVGHADEVVRIVALLSHIGGIVQVAPEPGSSEPLFIFTASAKASYIQGSASCCAGSNTR